MYRSYVVVDDFYPDPHAVRRAALALDYPAVQGVRTFPGRTSASKIEPPQFDSIASQLVGERVQGLQRPTAFHCHFRITLDGETGRYHAHVDPSGLAWVGVVYLSLPEHCRGGTVFYRHRVLGLDRTPQEQAALATLGVGTIAELLQRDGPDPAAWDETMSLAMRFNRAVFYRPWLWHSAGPGFGRDPEGARLVQLLSFVYPQQPQGRQQEQ
jgi:hypothetical protein